MKTPNLLHLFRPGQHTSMQGATLDFSETDLAACAAAYDPAKHEAPLVVGHPVANAPAYGWVKSLSAQADGLYAEVGQLDADFAELVEAGRYKKISASFYLPDSPHNPTPGVLYLRHVGFLGAQPPGIKGLKAVAFAEGEGGIADFSEDETPAADDSGSASISTQPQEAQEVTQEEKAALEAENAQLKSRVEQAEAQVKAAAIKRRHADNIAFAETLVGEGRLKPADKELVAAILDFCEAGEGTAEFGEGDAKQPMKEALKTFLQAAPKVVDFAETATKDRAATQDATHADDAADFAEAEPERLKQHRAVLAHMQAHPGMDYAAAARAVIR
jgi:hypothetical protein